MIDRQYNKMAFVCDNCGDGLVTSEKSWIAAKEVFDKEGWKAENDNGEWSHYCPSCRGDGGFREN